MCIRDRLYRKPDIVTDIKKSTIQWVEHVQRMLETSTLKELFTGRLDGRRRRGQPRERWLDDLEDDLLGLSLIHI